MYVSYYCRDFACSNSTEDYGDPAIRVSQRQTSTSPITLDHTSLQMVTNSTVNKPTTSNTMT